MKNYHKGLWLVLSTAMISGVSIFLNSIAVQAVAPTVLTGIRNFSVGLIVIGIIFMSRRWRIVQQLTIREWMGLLFVGFIGGSVPFVLFFNGLAKTTAAQAGFIHKTLFVYVSILAFFILKERITKLITIGIIVLLVGQTLFLQLTSFRLGFGDLLVFTATVLWSLEIVISKRLVATIHPNLVAAGRMFFGGAFIGGYILLTDHGVGAFALSREQFVWILITTVLLVGYVLSFYNGLRYVPAHVATSMLALGAPVTLLISAVFQEKTITLQQVGSMIVIALAITIISRFTISKKKDPLYVSEKNYS